MVSHYLFLILLVLYRSQCTWTLTCRCDDGPECNSGSCDAARNWFGPEHCQLVYDPKVNAERSVGGCNRANFNCDTVSENQAIEAIFKDGKLASFGGCCNEERCNENVLESKLAQVKNATCNVLSNGGAPANPSSSFSCSCNPEDMVTLFDLSVDRGVQWMPTTANDGQSSNASALFDTSSRLRARMSTFCTNNMCNVNTMIAEGLAAPSNAFGVCAHYVRADTGQAIHGCTFVPTNAPGNGSFRHFQSTFPPNPIADQYQARVGVNMSEKYNFIFECRSDKCNEQQFYENVLNQCVPGAQVPPAVFNALGTVGQVSGPAPPGIQPPVPETPQVGPPPPPGVVPIGPVLPETPPTEANGTVPNGPPPPGVEPAVAPMESNGTEPVVPEGPVMEPGGLPPTGEGNASVPVPPESPPVESSMPEGVPIESNGTMPAIAPGPMDTTGVEPMEIPPMEGSGMLPELPPMEGSGMLPELPPMEGSGMLPELLPMEGSGMLPEFPPMEGSGGIPELPPPLEPSMSEFTPTEANGTVPNVPEGELFPVESSGLPPDFPPFVESSPEPEMPVEGNNTGVLNLPPAEGAETTAPGEIFPPAEGSATAPEFPQMPMEQPVGNETGEGTGPPVVPIEGGATVPEPGMSEETTTSGNETTTTASAAVTGKSTPKSEKSSSGALGMHVLCILHFIPLFFLFAFK